MDAQEAYDKYPALLGMLTNIVKPLQLLPLKEMAEANERMQTLAPFVSMPLEYHRGVQNLQDQRRVIDAARELQVVLMDLVAEREG